MPTSTSNCEAGVSNDGDDDGVVHITLTVDGSAVHTWWPAGLGAQQLCVALSMSYFASMDVFKVSLVEAARHMWQHRSWADATAHTTAHITSTTSTMQRLLSCLPGTTCL